MVSRCYYRSLKQSHRAGYCYQPRLVGVDGGHSQLKVANNHDLDLRGTAAARFKAKGLSDANRFHLQYFSECPDKGQLLRFSGDRFTVMDSMAYTIKERSEDPDSPSVFKSHRHSLDIRYFKTKLLASRNTSFGASTKLNGI